MYTAWLKPTVLLLILHKVMSENKETIPPNICPECYRNLNEGPHAADCGRNEKLAEKKEASAVSGKIIAEIEAIFKRLGYNFDKNTLRKNYNYYVRRTSHGSTMSKVTHCFIAQLLGKPKEAWQGFLDVLESDIYDTQGGTTSEGIHVGVMGGSVDMAIRGFAGLFFSRP